MSEITKIVGAIITKINDKPVEPGTVTMDITLGGRSVGKTKAMKERTEAVMKDAEDRKKAPPPPTVIGRILAVSADGTTCTVETESNGYSRTLVEMMMPPTPNESVTLQKAREKLDQQAESIESLLKRVEALSKDRDKLRDRLGVQQGSPAWSRDLSGSEINQVTYYASMYGTPPDRMAQEMRDRGLIGQRRFRPEPYMITLESALSVDDSYKSAYEGMTKIILGGPDKPVAKPPAPPRGRFNNLDLDSSEDHEKK